MTTIKAIIFDFGRVISAQKPQSLFASYEVFLNLAPNTLNTIMFDSPLWEKALVGELKMSEYWQDIGSHLNLHNLEEVTAFQKRYYNDEKINQDVVQLLRILQTTYKLAILSNHPPGLIDWLQDWHIDYLFDEIICSGEEGMAKPNGQIFHLTLDRLKIAANEALFIDDTEEHVVAARALGLQGIVFTTSEALENRLQDMGIL